MIYDFYNKNNSNEVLEKYFEIIKLVNKLIKVLFNTIEMNKFNKYLTNVNSS